MSLTVPNEALYQAEPQPVVEVNGLRFLRPYQKKAVFAIQQTVQNDGFGLGAQRRVIEKNDLPQVQAELANYRQAPSEFATTSGVPPLSGASRRSSSHFRRTLVEEAPITLMTRPEK